MQSTLEKLEQCTAFCPKCGSDLLFRGNECICRKGNCGFHCEGCRQEDDV